MSNRSDDAILADVVTAETTKGRHVDMLLEFTKLMIELLLDCRKYLKEIKQAVEAE